MNSRLIKIRYLKLTSSAIYYGGYFTNYPVYRYDIKCSPRWPLYNKTILLQPAYCMRVMIVIMIN